MATKEGLERTSVLEGRNLEFCIFRSEIVLGVKEYASRVYLEFLRAYKVYGTSLLLSWWLQQTSSIFKKILWFFLKFSYFQYTHKVFIVFHFSLIPKSRRLQCFILTPVFYVLTIWAETQQWKLKITRITAQFSQFQPCLESFVMSIFSLRNPC